MKKIDCVMGSSQHGPPREAQEDPLLPGFTAQIRALLDANRATVAAPDLSVLLPAVVTASCDLIRIGYAAMVVVDSRGVIEHFVDSGTRSSFTDWIRKTPEGMARLSAVTTSRTVIRVPRITASSEPAGVADRHPEAAGFLGVPIRIRGEAFAALCIMDALDGDFTAQDESLLSALAAGTAVAIENSRLFSESLLRQEWLHACAEITGQLLSDPSVDPSSMIADRVLETARADFVNVVLPSRDGIHLEVAVATGRGATELAGRRFPMANTLSSLAINKGKAISARALGSLATKSEYGLALLRVASAGAVMAIPLAGTQQRGALVVGRMNCRAPFSDSDVTMVTMFADYAAVGLELADDRCRAVDAALLEDRSRIARDLHDHIIQRLYASGLAVQSVSSTAGGTTAANRLSDVIDEIDDIIRHIRTTIQILRGSQG